MSTPEYEAVEFPTQFPVLTGDGFVADDGTVRRTIGASMVLTFADGTERTVALQQRADGRWWVPAGTA